MLKFKWGKEFKETETGEIPKDWEVKVLKNVLKSLESGKRPKGGALQHDPYGILSIGGENISWQGDLILDNCLRFSEKFYKDLKKGKIAEDDILLVKDGATIGKLSYIRDVPEGKAMVNEHVFILKTDKTKYHSWFLYYFLLSESGQIQIESSITGSAQGGLNRGILDTIKLPVPSLPEQSRIATVLSWFDELMENKKRQNEILEKTAMEIFKSWFVDFEPFKNEEFVYNEELGKEIPKGWEVKRLGEVAVITMGQSPSSKFYNELGIGLPFIQGKGQFGRYTPETKVYCTDIIKIAKPYDILITVRAPVGDLNIANQQYVIGRGIASLRTNYWPFLFLYLFLFNDQLKSYERGTTYEAITKEELEFFPLLYPPSPILQRFHSLVEPLFQKIILNQKQIMILQKIRDTLLPLLVFGKLRVIEI